MGNACGKQREEETDDDCYPTIKIPRKQIDTTALKTAKVVFVVGGPGSGKGTQCDKIVEKYGYTHLSSGDLLREEVASQSRLGKELNKIMKAGKLVPLEIVLDLIKEAMLKWISTTKGFLLDGYPREISQALLFEEEVCPCQMVLYLEVPDDTMTQRLLYRGKTSGRVDDNEETVKKRLATFHKVTGSVLEHFEKQGKLRRVVAEASPPVVFKMVAKVFQEDLLKSARIIFVCGGPGSGKGTQCDRIVERYGFTHLSSGDLLRDEVASKSPRGNELNSMMQAGKLVPMETVLTLLKEAMIAKADVSNGFLIDGYPREVDQGIQFEKTICAAKMVLYFDLSDAEMTRRLLNRGKTSGRVDDNEETIAKRLETFHAATEPVTIYYDRKGKLASVNAERSPDQIFKDVADRLDRLILENCKVFFIVGGPGCGKGTQCERLAAKYNLTHLSSGDLLRAEVASGSPMGVELDAMMKAGKLVPMETVLKLIKDAMVAAALKGSQGFLIDGYPREVPQGVQFETLIKACDVVLYFNVTDETMTKRLLNRAKTSGRVDDNEETIKKRLLTFHECTQPVCDYYFKKGKLIEVKAEGTPDFIFEKTCKLLKEKVYVKK